jgi:hypothetical protein
LLGTELRRSGSALAGGCTEDTLAETERFRRRFHVLIDVDVLNGALKTQAERSFQLNPFAFALTADVGEMLRLARIDR